MDCAHLTPLETKQYYISLLQPEELILNMSCCFTSHLFTTVETFAKYFLFNLSHLYIFLLPVFINSSMLYCLISQ